MLEKTDRCAWQGVASEFDFLGGGEFARALDACPLRTKRETPESTVWECGHQREGGQTVSCPDHTIYTTWFDAFTPPSGTILRSIPERHIKGEIV